MSKTKEELELLKKDYEALKSKLKGLSDEEIKQVTGGFDYFGIPTFDKRRPNAECGAEPEDKPNIIIDNGTGYTK